MRFPLNNKINTQQSIWSYSSNVDMFAPALQFGNTVESRNFVYIALSIRDYFKASSIKHLKTNVSVFFF